MSLAGKNPFSCLEVERGGRHQRHKRPRLLETRSFLAEKLIIGHGEGRFHATDVQDLAWCCFQDIVASGGVPPEALRRLAKLGSEGKYRQNVKEELQNYVKTLVDIVQPEEVDMPLKLQTGPALGINLLPQAYVPIHLWISNLFHNFKSDFDARFLGPPGRLEQFWDSVHPNDPRRSHPLFRRPNFRSKCIPLILYGDGVPCSGDSLQVVGVESLVTELENSWEKLGFLNGFFLMTAVDSKDKYGLETKIEFWRPIVAYLLLCEKGGKHLFGDYFFGVLMNKSDYDWTVNALNLPGHWQSHDPCVKCGADIKTESDGSAARSSMFYFKPDMSWLSRIFTAHAAWIAHCLSKSPVPPFMTRKDGGLGLSCIHIFYDPLHAACLGVVLHLLGGFLWLLCYSDLLGRKTAQQKLDQVWKEVNIEYGKQPPGITKLTKINLKSFCDPDRPKAEFPKLKAKAAQARHLVPVMHRVFLKFLPGRRLEDAQETHQHLAKCLEYMAEFYKCLNYKDASGRYPFILPGDVLSTLRSSVGKFLIHYTHAARACADKKLMLFNMVSKFHQLYHIAHDAHLLNPRFIWTYAEESWVGRIAKLGASRGHGKTAAMRSFDICLGWLTGQTLRLYFNSLEARTPVRVD